jgi:hypothetical protein
MLLLFPAMFVFTGCSSSSSSSPDLPDPPDLTFTATAKYTEIDIVWDADLHEDAVQTTLCLAPSPVAGFDNCAASQGQLIAVDGGEHTVSGLDIHRPYYLMLEADYGSSVTAVSPQLAVVTSHGFNDTGIDWCANEDENELECPVANYPAQDGESGRDALARDGQLPGKIGGGAAGFDYTRICGGGEAEGEGACPPGLDVPVVPDIGDSAEQWACTRDNITGLMWEVKVDDEDHLRHMDHTYTWYDPDDAVNGGGAGEENGGACVDEDNCDTRKYVDAINAQGLCGYDDWRLPSRHELMSIVHNGRPAAQLTIDPAYFPNVPDNPVYWSTSPYADDSELAWRIGFASGVDFADFKGNSYHVRLVRGSTPPVAVGQVSCTGTRNEHIIPTTPSGDFENRNGGAVVLHLPTGLEWQRCPLGMNWNGLICTGVADGYTWQEALQAAAGDGWRLPNKNEMATTIEESCSSQAFNDLVFPGIEDMLFWTSSSIISNLPDLAWCLNYVFDNQVGSCLKGQSFSVRLVRTGE